MLDIFPGPCRSIGCERELKALLQLPQSLTLRLTTSREVSIERGWVWNQARSETTGMEMATELAFADDPVIAEGQENEAFRTLTKIWKAGRKITWASLE